MTRFPTGQITSAPKPISRLRLWFWIIVDLIGGALTIGLLIAGVCVLVYFAYLLALYLGAAE